MTQSIEQQRKHFNSISDVYIESRKHPNHLLVKDLLWRHFFGDKWYLSSECRRVLEPMCGLGEGYEILRKYALPEGFHYQGFDYSENMIATARERHPNLYFEWGDALEFSSDHADFDMVILIGGLHHVYQRARDVVSRLSLALRKGGYFLSFEPTHNSWLNRRVRERIYARNVLFDNETEQGFEFKELERIFGQQGYSKVDEVYAGLLAYILYYNPDAFPMLNRGSRWAVRGSFALDRMFWRNAVGRKLSFATVTLWRRE